MSTAQAEARTATLTVQRTVPSCWVLDEQTLGDLMNPVG